MTFLHNYMWQFPVNKLFGCKHHAVLSYTPDSAVVWASILSAALIGINHTSLAARYLLKLCGHKSTNDHRLRGEKCKKFLRCTIKMHLNSTRSLLVKRRECGVIATPSLFNHHNYVFLLCIMRQLWATKKRNDTLNLHNITQATQTTVDCERFSSTFQAK